MSATFCLMLHSHIPYCKKSGVWPAGEEWLFEAINECYIPLLTVLRRLHLEGIRPGITIGIVPILALQLSDSYMKARFLEYMGDKILRAQHDLERFEDDPRGGASHNTGSRSLRKTSAFTSRTLIRI